MGYLQAQEMADMDLSLKTTITWHLRHNHYPPVSGEMVPVAVKAVELCRKNKFNETIVIFFEHQDYELFGWSVPAYVIVDIFHLEPWVNEEVD